MAKRFSICIVDVNQLAAVVRNRIDNVLILDSRSFLEYNASHVINAINVGCAKLVKRRLQQNRLTIQDFLVHNCHWDVDASIDIVVYDQNTQDPADLPPDSFMSVFLEKLLPVYKSVNFLKGGFLEFQASYPNLCEDEKAKFTPLTSVSQPCLPISNNGPTRILSFLYLGSQHDALNKEILQSHNITYELNVSTNCPKPDFIQEARFMRIPVIDNYSDKLLPYFPRAFQFLDKVRESGGCVLVHCLAGISRSATVAIAYVMRHLKLSSDEAYRYVKSKRATISPNFNFLGQLLEYENQLQQEKILNPKSDSTTLMTHAVWNERYENGLFQKSLVPERNLSLSENYNPVITSVEIPLESTFSLNMGVNSVKSTNDLMSSQNVDYVNNKINKNSCEKFPNIETGEWNSKCIPVSSLKELNFTPCQAAVTTSSFKVKERYSPRQSNLWSAIDSFVKTNVELSEQGHGDLREQTHFNFTLTTDDPYKCQMEIQKSYSCGSTNTWSEMSNSLSSMQPMQLSPKNYTRSSSTSTSGLGSESSDCFESWSDYPSPGDKGIGNSTNEEFAQVPTGDMEDDYNREKMFGMEDSYEEPSLYPKFGSGKLFKNEHDSLFDDAFLDYSSDFAQENSIDENIKCSLQDDDEMKKSDNDKPCGLYRAQSCPGILSSELVPCSSTCDHTFTYNTVHLRTAQSTNEEKACKQRNRYSCGSLDYGDNSMHISLQKSFSASGNTAASTMSPSHQLFRRSMIQVS